MATDLTTPTGIKAAYDSFWTDVENAKLRLRMEGDYDLWTLKPYNAGKGYFSYTTNQPRTLANRVISSVVRSKLTARVPSEVLREEDRKIASNNERLFYGALNMMDKYERARGNPTIRQQMAWFSTIRGGFGQLIYVHKNEKGVTEPQISIWDRYSVAYSAGADGVFWMIHRFPITKERAKAEWNVNIGSNDTTFGYDVWSTENNAVVIGDQWGKEPEKHGLDRCPAFIVLTGWQPQIWQQNGRYTRQYQGESVFAADRQLFPIKSKTISDLLTIVRRGVKVPLAYKSRGGEKTLDQDIYQVEKGATISMDIDDKLEPVIEPSMPRDSGVLVNYVDGEIQQGGLSSVNMGQLGFRLSGYAINSLKDDILMLIDPFVGATEYACSLIACELLYQYADSNLPPIKVQGRSSKNEPFGFPAPYEIKPTDVNKEWTPEVKLEPTLPRDDAQRYQMARMATEGEAPLLSLRSAREDILQIDDTDLEDEIVKTEKTEMLPLVMLHRRFQALKAQGDFDAAEVVLIEIVKYLMSQGQKPTKGIQSDLSSVPMMPTEEAAMTVPGGMPSGQTGLSPETMPPEAMGGFPGGAVGAVQ